MKQKAGRVAFTGLLAALAIALSFLEGLLPPLPMMPPGAKLGLSNLATMYAAGSLGLPSALFLAVFKGVFALVTRGGMAGLMSLSGGVVSTVVMWLSLIHISTPPEGEVSGHSKTNGADVRQRPQQARRSAAAPWREETAEALRCGATWCASWPNTAGRGSEPQPWGPGRPSGDCRATGSSNQKVLPWPRVLVTP